MMSVTSISGVDAQRRPRPGTRAAAGGVRYSATLEDVGTGTQVATVLRREFFFDGDLERCVGYAVAVRSEALVLDVSLIAPLDEVAAARLKRVRRCLGNGLVLVCRAGGPCEARGQTWSRS